MLLSLRVDLINISDWQADSPKQESAIDELVASRVLYGLTEDEVRIVEGEK